MKKIVCLLIAVCLATTAFAQKGGKGRRRVKGAADNVVVTQPAGTEVAKEAAQQNAVPQASIPQDNKDMASLPPVDAALEKDLLDATEKPAQPQTDSFVAERETVAETEVEKKETKQEEPKIVYNPKKNVDPTLSPDDILLIEYREQQRLAAEEAERQRKLAEERRKQEEAERQRQLELARLKDPTREVRNKIRIGGIIGQEVFIGSKIYTVGNSIFGARIVEVRSDTEEVVFTYKGHKFVRRVQLSK